MRRHAPRPWYRTGRQMWMGKIGGRDVPLGVTDPDDRPAAVAAMTRLVEQLAAAAATLSAGGTGPPATPPPGSPAPSAPHNGPTVARVMADYLADCERRASAGKLGRRPLADYRRFLEGFAAAFGPRPAASVTPAEAERWADRPDWSQTYQRFALSVIRSAFAFARLVLPVRRPPAESRGADVLIDAERFELLLATLGDRTDLPQLLRVLRGTGARPGEAAPLTVEGVDWTNCHARLRAHKTARKTGQPRLLVFAPPVMAVLLTQRVKYGRGLLFRTTAGKAYTPKVIGQRLRKLAKRIGGGRLITYGLRHGYATDALAAGESDTVVAALLGHTSTAMIHAHYSHVSENSRTLRAAADRIANRPPEPRKGAG